jgi:hypothetical protein
MPLVTTIEKQHLFARKTRAQFLRDRKNQQLIQQQLLMEHRIEVQPNNHNLNRGLAFRDQRPTASFLIHSSENNQQQKHHTTHGDLDNIFIFSKIIQEGSSISNPDSNSPFFAPPQKDSLSLPVVVPYSSINYNRKTNNNAPTTKIMRTHHVFTFGVFTYKCFCPSCCSANTNNNIIAELTKPINCVDVVPGDRYELVVYDKIAWERCKFLILSSC